MAKADKLLLGTFTKRSEATSNPGSGTGDSSTGSGTGDSSTGSGTGSSSGSGTGDSSTGSGTGSGSSGNSTGSSSGSGTGSSTGNGTAALPTVVEKTETKADGTKVNTKTETKADGTKKETVTETKTDGSATITVRETEKNASGREVAVTTEAKKDAGGRVTEEKKTSVIAEAAKDTSVTVTSVKDGTGVITSATAEVTKAGSRTASGATKGNISSAVVAQVVAAAGTNDVVIRQTVTNGDGSGFTVSVNAKELESGVTLKIMKIDSKTGELVLCNKKSYDVNGAGGLSLTIGQSGEYVLMTEKEAKEKSDAILKTVRLKESKKDVRVGKTSTVKMSSKLNMNNVSKISYKSSKKSVAKVNSNGKITAKKKGRAVVTATVTLKNGKTKKVKMTITVK